MKKRISKKQKRKTYKKKRSYKKQKGGNNSITDTAFIIPIYPAHYQNIYNFIDKLNTGSIKVDIYLVFSNNNEYEEFIYKDSIKPIIIREPLTTNCIVSFKKFYGLKHLINSSYNYFIVCDSESDIVIENFTASNITKKINSIFENKIVYGEKTNDNYLISIMKTCSNLFSISEQDILKSATEEFTLYTWWSDLPVYKKEDLTDFFNKISYDNIVREHFDYIIYQYYLILNYNFKLINTDTALISLRWNKPFTDIEDEMKELNRLKELKFGFSFIPVKTYKDHQDFLKKEGTFLVGNIDV